MRYNCNNNHAMSIKDRFKMIMDREKLTAGAFAESIGCGPSYHFSYFRFSQ